MARSKDPDEDEKIEDEGTDYLDWEASRELVKKMLNVLRSLTVHEALLTLVAACDTLAKGARHDWDITKVRQVLEDL
jgi:hypothetical protein